MAAHQISASLASWVTKSRAQAALLKATDAQLQALAILPPELRTVRLGDVADEIAARARVAERMADHDLALRRQRAEAWCIPIALPFRSRTRA